LQALSYGGTVTDQQSDILMIGGDNPTTWIVYNRLVREFGPFPCIIEDGVPKTKLLRNRHRRLGFVAAAGQLAFVTLVRPILRYQSAKRVKLLCRSFDLEPRRPYSALISHVASANDAEAVSQIRAAAPKIVIVNGTRILKPYVLQAVRATFINTHQGITPRYRGAHGAYWALHEGDGAQCGVTVHLVDEGIDTGNIVGQAVINPEPDDGFVTYPFLQTAAALPILSNAIHDIRAGTLKTHAISGPSAVWYHPGILQYLRGRMRGVR
jgi:folate-dependent phosphoribosylglycinamide formyltransferase PurN